MSDSVDILKKLALQVRNASTEGENTAERIGRIFIGILENMDNSDLESSPNTFCAKTRRILQIFFYHYWAELSLRNTPSSVISLLVY